MDKCGIPWLRHRTCLVFISPFWSTMTQDHCEDVFKTKVLPVISATSTAWLSPAGQRSWWQSLRRRISTGIFKPKHQSHASRVIPGLVYITSFDRRKPTLAFQKKFINTKNAKPASRAGLVSVPQTNQSSAALMEAGADCCLQNHASTRQLLACCSNTGPTCRTAVRAAGSLHHLLASEHRKPRCPKQQ